MLKSHHAHPSAPPEKPLLDYSLHLPGTARRGSPLLVVLPGTGASPPAAVRALATWAERCGVVLLAPFFGRAPYREYARLTGAARADLALLALVDEVAKFSSAGGAQIHLFGVGTGADFAHRFVLAHPERVASAVVASAEHFVFPGGAAGCTEAPAGIELALEEALEVPILVTADPGTAAGATAWVDAMRAVARDEGLPPLTLYEPDPGAAKLPRRVFEFCFGA